MQNKILHKMNAVLTFFVLQIFVFQQSTITDFINRKVNAYQMIYTSKDCNDCFYNVSGGWSSICTSRWGYGSAYCCTDFDMNYSNPCAGGPLCSRDISRTFQGLTCPYEQGRCDLDSPYVNLNLGQEQRITIDINLNPNNTCFYHFSVKDPIDPATVNLTQNRKFMQVYFDNITAVDGWVASAIAPINISTTTKIDYYNFNFTQAPTQNYYIMLKSASNTQIGQYNVSILLKYYLYDPQCSQFQDWSDIFLACMPNYTRYCDSLTPQYQQQENTTNLVVQFNGTECVVMKTLIQNRTILEYVTVNVTVNSTQSIQKVFNVTILPPTIKKKSLTEGKRKTQRLLNIFTLTIMLAIFTYSIVDFIEERQKKIKEEAELIKLELELQQLQQLQDQKMNAEKNLIPVKFKGKAFSDNRSLGTLDPTQPDDFQHHMASYAESNDTGRNQDISNVMDDNNHRQFHQDQNVNTLLVQSALPQIQPKKGIIQDNEARINFNENEGMLAANATFYKKLERNESELSGQDFNQNLRYQPKDNKKSEQSDVVSGFQPQGKVLQEQQEEELENKKALYFNESLQDQDKIDDGSLDQIEEIK